MQKLLFLLLIVLIACHNPNKKIGIISSVKKPPFLILNSAGSLGAYAGELLKAEGFNEYDIQNTDVDSLSLNVLESYDWVFLPKMELSQHELKKIITYIKGGGNLVSFLPSVTLMHLLNIGSIADTLDEGYVQIDSGTEIGKGLLSTPLKFHGEGILLHNAGPGIIARFPARDQHELPWPAVTSQDIEMGHALCFLYDLPRNIMLTRQGNPDLANIESDGISGLRATDLFTGNWIDTAMNCLNPADEHLRLLTHSIEVLSANKKPLPRFWYFPDSLNCLATLTNDGEKNGEKDFLPQLQEVAAKGAKMTLYTLNSDKLSKSFVDSLVQAGYEIAAHPDAARYSEKPNWAIMTKAIRDKLSELETNHGIVNIATNANHWFVWCGVDSADNPDFSAQAKIESNLGIRLDVNYAHYDNHSREYHFLGAQGYRQGIFEGSGMPLRFADTEGKVIDIFQHFNNVYDQQYMERKDSAGFFQCFKGIVDRSIDQEIYSYISIKAHNNEYFFSKTPLMQMLDYANERHVPIWTAAELYKFLKTKDEAYFSDISFKRSTLIFSLHSAISSPNGLSFLIPMKFNNKTISMIKGNELDFPVAVKKIKGTDYAFITVQPGHQYGFRISYK